MPAPSSPSPDAADASLAERLRDRLVTLVGIPSPSREERAIADHYERELAGATAWSVQRVGHNLALTPVRPHPGRRVLICGHLDTVPAQGNEVPRVEGDQVFGVGSTDLKAGLAVMQELWETLPPEECQVAPVYVLFDREEVAFRESGLEQLVVACPWIQDVDFVVCVEPTGNVVELGCLGTMSAQVTVRGHAAHSARPWLGHNAIHAALPILERVARRPERPVRLGPDGDLLYREVMSVTTLAGGHAKNVIPHTATFNVNFRFGPDRSIEQAKDVILSLVGDEGEVEFTDLSPAGHVCSDNPDCARLVALSGAAPRAKQAWTDVGRFSGWGVDAVSFGPGIPEQAHQQGEFARVSDMVQHLRCLSRFLRGEGPTP